MKQTRRQLLGTLLAGFGVAGVAAGVRANSGVQLPTRSTGNLKAGPLGLNPGADDGQIPVSIAIPDAKVDAEVERNKIVGGQMLDPSGPWVVAWYEGTGLVGERDNSVMSGHVDYWDVGPAVFYDVAKLQKGAPINVEGDNGTIYTYNVDYVERVTIAELDQDKINEIVGHTDYAALTLITCGGEFNGQEYVQRDIIRARLAGSTGGQETAPATQVATEASSPTAAAEEPTVAPATETQATVSSDVNLRANPSTSAEIVGALAAGDVVTVTGAAQDADGYTWLPVRLADGTGGWVIQDALSLGQ